MKVGIFGSRSLFDETNSEILKWHLFTYTNLPLNAKITDSVIETICKNACAMTKDADTFNIVRF
jgi:hypothetical protein